MTAQQHSHHQQGATTMNYGFGTNPRAILKAMIDASHNPRLESEQQRIAAEFDALMTGPAGEPHVPLFVAYFRRNTMNNILRTFYPPPSRDTDVAAARARLDTQMVDELDRRATRLVLDMIAPNGKRLGDCSKAELETIGNESISNGNKYLELSKRIASAGERLRDAVNEDEARKIWGE